MVALMNWGSLSDLRRLEDGIELLPFDCYYCLAVNSKLLVAAVDGRIESRYEEVGLSPSWL